MKKNLGKPCIGSKQMDKMLLIIITYYLLVIPNNDKFRPTKINDQIHINQ